MNSQQNIEASILADSVTLDLTNPAVQNQGSLTDTLGNTVLFALTNFSGGSGNSNPFLRLKAAEGDTVQRGYNTGGTPDFDTQQTGTSPILLNQLPLVTIDNTKYYEFRIDLNESNSNPQISLTKLQVYQSSSPNLTGYNFDTQELAGLSPVINLNSTVLMDASLNPGSGVGDVLVYLPQQAFTGNPYIYTYAEFQDADSGYEEFSYKTTNDTPVANLDLSKQFITVNQQPFADVKQAIDTDQDGKADQFIALPGDNVTYQITVTNNDVTNAEDVVIKDDLTKQLPVGLIVQSLDFDDSGTNLDAAGGGDGNPQTVEVSFNNIAPGTSKTIIVNAKVSTDYITPINFTGTLGNTNLSGNVNTALPEYQNVPFQGKVFLNYNVQKKQNNYSLQDIKEGRANFGFLNITSTAEVVSVNQQMLAPGSIKADSRLDVTNYAIQGQLNNGYQFKILGVENLIHPNGSDISIFLNPDPDKGTDSAGYIKNYSKFLPDDQTGSVRFLGTWAKNNNPQYLAYLKVWEQLKADGDLSNTADEQAVINALSDFIEIGTYSRSFFSNGYFSFSNNTQTQNLTFEAGELSPTPSSNSLVTILVTDKGATVTDKQGNSLGSFANLQTALDSFKFTQPTDVKVKIKDSDGNGQVQTRLQKVGGYNFNGNWSITSITVDSNVRQVTFASSNGSANLDFSAINIVPNPQNPYQLILRGDNGKDTITGSNRADSILGSNGNDVLSGADGNDSIDGGRGDDTLTGGRGNDYLTGGLGSDEFVFGAYFGNDTISDWGNPDKLNFRELRISSSVLDSNNDGVINTQDNLATLSNGNLKLDLTSVVGGTIAFTGITSIRMANVIL